uniref:CCHC-type domain-containing protein n=1 Tax=Anopheles atroparvus TaxID=41427 RepID=A0AAG5CT59_ANOAO
MEGDEQRAVPEARFTFADIGDSLEKFSGDRAGRDIHEWIEEFETTSESFGWSDAHKFVYGRRLLEGTAKLFVQSTSGLNRWAILKAALAEEFGERVSSAEIHRRLRERRKKADETILQYIYHMQNLAKRAHVEDEAVCEYVASGVNDVPTNKVCLYGATTISELKERAKQYERMKAQMGDQNKRGDLRYAQKNPSLSAPGPTTTTISDRVRCYNCGRKGHYAKECETKSQGPKCFTCGKQGHRARDCDQVVVKTEVNTISEGMPVCEIRYRDVPLKTLFDTGSRH